MVARMGCLGQSPVLGSDSIAKHPIAPHKKPLMQKVLQQEDVPLISVSLLSLSWWLSEAKWAFFPLQQRKEMGMGSPRKAVPAPCCWLCPTLRPHEPHGEDVLLDLSFIFLQRPQPSLCPVVSLPAPGGPGMGTELQAGCHLKPQEGEGGVGGLRVNLCKHRGCFTNRPLPQPQRDPMSPWGGGGGDTRTSPSLGASTLLSHPDAGTP